MVKLAPLAGRNTLFHPHIGTQRLARIGQQPFELGLDHRGMRFQLVEPGKVLAVKIFVGRQERIIQPGAFVLIRTAAAKRAVDESGDPALAGLVPLALALGENGIGAGGKPGTQGFAIGQPFGKFCLHLRRQPILPRGKLADIVPRDQCRLLLAHALKQLRHAQLGTEIEPVERQRPVKRDALASVISGQAVGVGEVAPQRQRGGIGLGGAGEGGDSRRAIAGTNRGHAPGIGFERLGGRLGQRRGQGSVER